MNSSSSGPYPPCLCLHAGTERPPHSSTHTLFIIESQALTILLTHYRPQNRPHPSYPPLDDSLIHTPSSRSVFDSLSHSFHSEISNCTHTHTHQRPNSHPSSFHSGCSNQKWAGPGVNRLQTVSCEPFLEEGLVYY